MLLFDICSVVLCVLHNEEPPSHTKKNTKQLRPAKSVACVARFHETISSRPLPTISRVGSGQEVCFGLSRPDFGRNAQDQGGTRGRHGPPPGDLDGSETLKNKAHGESGRTPSDPAWDLHGPRIAPRRGFWVAPPEPVTDV